MFASMFTERTMKILIPILIVLYYTIYLCNVNIFMLKYLLYLLDSNMNITSINKADK